MEENLGKKVNRACGESGREHKEKSEGTWKKRDREVWEKVEREGGKRERELERKGQGNWGESGRELGEREVNLGKGKGKGNLA